MQKGGEMKDMLPVNKSTLLQTVKSAGSRFAHGLRRAVVGTIAVIVMMVAYGVSTLGAIGSSALGLAGITAATTIAATSTPAQARRWRRRRRWGRGRRWHRGRRWRRGRYRRRRRGGVYLYF